MLSIIFRKKKGMAMIRFPILSFLAFLVCSFGSAQEKLPPVQVKFHEPKVELSETVLPVDPTPRVRYSYVGQMAFGLYAEEKLLCCGDGAIRTNFRIDGQTMYPNVNNAPSALAPNKFGKPRHGIQHTWIHGNLHITQILEIVPSKADPKALPGQKRRMDALLVRYLIENKDTRPHDVGVRVRIDTLCVDNDGALFASPTTHPGKILDGMELKDKDLPEYVQILQRPDLQNPLFVGHYTLKVGKNLEGPNRFVMTSHRVGDNGWDVPVVPAGGDSDCVIFFDPKPIPAGGKREVAYAYGQGIAASPENEGKVTMVLEGSFEPGKQFTVTAFVDEPLENQSLTLVLPEGIERLEGKETQPVPLPTPGMATSLVFWKARVQRLGEFPIQIRSSNAITQTRTVTISR